MDTPRIVTNSDLSSSTAPLTAERRQQIADHIAQSTPEGRLKLLEHAKTIGGEEGKAIESVLASYYNRTVDKNTGATIFVDKQDDPHARTQPAQDATAGGQLAREQEAAASRESAARDASSMNPSTVGRTPGRP